MPKFGSNKSLSVCKGCKSIILFIRTLKGKWMPCDSEKVVAKMNDKITLVLDTGEIKRKAACGESGYVPHWGTCLSAKKFKKSK